MNPEQAVRAYEDLGAGHFVAIHHSTFQLTDEHPAEPLERLGAEWTRTGHDPSRLWIPRAGEDLILKPR
jgi:L-ascorbate metabolism protein UlaG (beta-lactamase superfamily)